MSFDNLRTNGAEFDLPDSAGQPPEPPRRRRSLRTGTLIVISLLAIICLGAGALFSYRLLVPTKPSIPAATNAPQNNEPLGPPASAATPTYPPYKPGIIPPDKRPTLTVGFPSFYSYLPITLIPSLNPQAYNIVLVPINFQDTEGAQVINEMSESDQVRKLKNGEFDLLLTTTDTQAKHPSMGKTIDILDRSDGADFTVAWKVGKTPGCAGRQISIFNDLKPGCTIAVAGDSVSEYQALSWILAAGYTPQDVPLARYATMEEAVEAFESGQTDALSTWLPPEKAPADQIIDLLSSAYLHTIYDGVFISPQADATKHDAAVAFLADYYRIFKMLVENPAVTANAIAAWQYTDPYNVTHETNYWSYVSKDNAEEDLIGGLSTIAQAGLDNALSYVDHPELYPDIVGINRKAWMLSGADLEEPFNPGSLFDPSYLAALRDAQDLRPVSGTVPDPTFSPFPPSQTEAPTADQLIKIPTLVEFTCTGVYFGGGQAEIDLRSEMGRILRGCADTGRQLLNLSDANLLITGSAARPDPEKFGSQYTEAYSLDLAKRRALWGYNTLINLGIPANRMAVTWTVGPVTRDPAVMHESRFVTLELKPGTLR